MRQSPCLDCPNRKINCHSKCRKYTEFRERIDYINDITREKKRGGRSVDIARARTIELQRRRRGLRTHNDIP